jgi:hypothetical protein
MIIQQNEISLRLKVTLVTKKYKVFTLSQIGFHQHPLILILTGGFRQLNLVQILLDHSQDQLKHGFILTWHQPNINSVI